MKYIIKGACQSVVGNVRENNEDNYYFNFKTLKEENDGSNKIATTQFENVDNVIVSVFDGMGGETKGERASYIASSTLKEYMQKNTSKEFEWEHYIEIANQRICDEMVGSQRMGTTLAAVQFLKDYITVCNLGDSRIYALKNNSLKQVSVDHTEKRVNEILNISSRSKPRLTQNLGIRKSELTLKPYIGKIEYNHFDKILICSDGLTDMVSEEDIQKILSKKVETKEIVNLLVQKALKNGGHDNITVIVLEKKRESKINVKKVALIIAIIIAIFAIALIIMNKNKFKIIEDGYNGAITVGQSYTFEYQGNVEITLSNDNIEYNDGKITALKEGTTVITITDKNGETLYSQTVKVFPN